MKIENPKISAVIITKDDLNCINAIKSVYNSVIEIILVNTAKTSKVRENSAARNLAVKNLVKRNSAAAARALARISRISRHGNWLPASNS